MAKDFKFHPDPYYTLEEYFALEKASDRRYEYWDGEIVCMTGGTLAHGQISRNLFRAIDRKIEGTNCQAFTADMAIKTPVLPPYRYADASVICGDVEVEQIGGIEVLVNPVFVAEVLSPNSEALDRNEKRAAYQAIVSVQEYLIVSQDIPHMTQYIRDGDLWRRFDYSTPAEAIQCRSLGIALTFAETYQGVRFE